MALFILTENTKEHKCTKYANMSAAIYIRGNKFNAVTHDTMSTQIIK